jgi:predicted nuclease with TOPRIM domain
LHHYYAVALEMKQRQVELTKVEEELKKRNQEILDLQLRLHEAEKTLVR